MDATEKNEVLLQSMKQLAGSRNEMNRKSMYMALLHATFIVPLEDSAEQDEPLPFAKDEPLHNLPVYVAFTSVKAMQKWRPEQEEFEEIKGTDLFPRLNAERIGSLLINPRNPIGGELYRNEVMVIAEAVPRLLRRTKKNWV
ncbi:MAG: SseB family protein [Deltaproteobacteria bacterium]|nr:MAG: SseB family protein [Deltaproteobacteria bacterium]